MSKKHKLDGTEPFIETIKSMIEEHTAAELLETHPGLMPALTQAQKRLGLVGMNR